MVLLVLYLMHWQMHSEKVLDIQSVCANTQAEGEFSPYTDPMSVQV